MLSAGSRGFISSVTFFNDTLITSAKACKSPSVTALARPVSQTASSGPEIALYAYISTSFWNHTSVDHEPFSHRIVAEELSLVRWQDCGSVDNRSCDGLSKREWFGEINASVTYGLSFVLTAVCWTGKNLSSICVTVLYTVSTKKRPP